MVLVFEDAHTLKAPMLELVERLGTRARGGPRRAMVLALARPELIDERSAWGASTVNAVLLRLDPLSDEESVDLVRQASGGRIEEAEAAEIAARADGNPFFIIETTGMLMPDSSTPRGDLPPTVQAVVSARLDALPAAAARAREARVDVLRLVRPRRARGRSIRRPRSTSSGSSRRPRSSFARRRAGRCRAGASATRR